MYDLSIVIPVRDEEQNINTLVDRLVTELENLKKSFEIIFVTDINKDNTYDILKGLNAIDNRIKTIKLSNSYGQHVAVVAGLNACNGNAVVIMDGDLQDYPEDIPKLYLKMQEGYDIVYGTKDKKDDSFIRNLFSKLFISILSKLSDAKIDLNTSMFRIISRRTVREVLRFEEREPSLTFIMGLIGFPTSTVKVESGERKAGETKYGFFRLVNFAISSLISFSRKPIRLISIVGLISSGLSFIYLIIVLLQKLFFSIGMAGWPTIIALITFLGGMQLLGLGIIGEYIGRVFIETKKRPLYIVDENVGDFEYISNK